MRLLLCSAMVFLVACVNATEEIQGEESVSLVAAGAPSYTAFLKGQDGDAFVAFVGQSLAFDGDTVIGGAPDHHWINDSDGGAWVFARQGDTWSQQAFLHLTSQESHEGAWFAGSVAIEGDVLAVGTPRSGAGKVFIYERTAGVWTRTATLRPLTQDPFAFDDFGHQVALEGGTLVVGAPGDSSAATGVGGDPNNADAPSSGAVYVFQREGSDWTVEAYIKPSNTTAGHAFGRALARSGDTLVAGSHDDSSATGVNGDQDNTDSPLSGAVFVFQRGPAGWAQQAYVKASNTGAGDGFGSSVSLSGDTLAIAATGEDSAATGVDGDQTSNAVQDSGAVYVFTRDADTWSQQAYVKASNTGTGDQFGRAVAVEGDRLAVGTRDEDSAATGIDGDQLSEAAPNSGAVYLFERCGASWAQSHYVKAFNAQPGDFFGQTLAWDQGRLAIGAPEEKSCAYEDPTGDCLTWGAVYLLE